MTPFSFQPRWSFTEGDREGSSAEGEGEGISKHRAKAAQGLLNREPGAGGAPAACGVPPSPPHHHRHGHGHRVRLWPSTLPALFKQMRWRNRAKPVLHGQFWEHEDLLALERLACFSRLHR